MGLGTCFSLPPNCKLIKGFTSLFIPHSAFYIGYLLIKLPIEKNRFRSSVLNKGNELIDQEQFLPRVWVVKLMEDCRLSKSSRKDRDSYLLVVPFFMKCEPPHIWRIYGTLAVLYILGLSCGTRDLCCHVQDLSLWCTGSVVCSTRGLSSGSVVA